MSRQPIPRRYIENALNYLESLKGELEGGLDPEKGFVSGYYLQEKLHDFSREVQFIVGGRYTDEVEPPKETAHGA